MLFEDEEKIGYIFLQFQISRDKILKSGGNGIVPVCDVAASVDSSKVTKVEFFDVVEELKKKKFIHPTNSTGTHFVVGNMQTYTVHSKAASMFSQIMNGL